MEAGERTCTVNMHAAAVGAAVAAQAGVISYPPPPPHHPGCLMHFVNPRVRIRLPYITVLVLEQMFSPNMRLLKL